MRTSFFIITFLFQCYNSFGQIFSPQVLSSGGGVASGESLHQSWTLGESVIETTGNQSLIFTQGFQQSDLLRSLAGQVTYHGNPLKPLGGINVLLYSDSSVVGQTMTGPAGNYLFPVLDNGSYSLDAICTKAWGGGNAIDALKVMKHFTEIEPLTGIALDAANVDSNDYVNSIDAFLILKRFVGIIGTFPKGSWLFENHTVFVDGFNSMMDNFKGSCYGDVDGSYVITGAKTEPSIFLERSGKCIVKPYEIFELPFLAREEIVPASLSCILRFPADQLEILGVSVCHHDKNLVFNVSGDELRLGWYTLEPEVLQEGDVFFTLTARLKPCSAMNSCKQDICLDAESVAGDFSGKTIKEFTLTTPRLIVESNGFWLDQNRPNPFSASTEIRYFLPFDGFTRLSLLDVTGKQVKLEYEGSRTAGPGVFTLISDDLAPGLYFYRMTLETENQHYCQTRRLVIAR